MLNSALVYPETGSLAYTILTRSHYIRANEQEDKDTEVDAAETRRTIILNKEGNVVAEIGWKGRQPVEIVIGNEKVVGARGMFGCSSAILSTGVFGIPTRFDTEYFWMAAPDALTLLDYDADQVKGQFHFNSIRVGDRFIPTHLHGVGNDYLEFDPHSLASTEELIVTFILVEILRRGRFNLTPYVFDRPKLWSGAHLASLGRRLRRRSI
ncbi:hypothetical protein SERLA73DRAFT_95092 [Serpula lacrymans var. lacrymans S7.3]|uniref:DUF6593 domain-containing protein n=2 Tax=Serpula lacrymans var. lacrymans TaxID=341189 RepID=F8Q7P1_SERL3|nr:hypothetical protein SERLA73DRAFT_95092 [Serpula lacrymans var. lacrymans S7.3]